jgi:hypothetical protein
MSFKSALLFALNAVSLTLVFFSHFHPPSAALIRGRIATQYPPRHAQLGFSTRKIENIIWKVKKKGKTRYLPPVSQQKHYFGNQVQSPLKKPQLLWYRHICLNNYKNHCHGLELVNELAHEKLCNLKHRKVSQLIDLRFE